MSEHSFSSLPFLSSSPDLLSNLQSLGFESMTAIQAQSLPAILEGKDIIAQGQTGSGKTAAFALGILSTIDPSLFKVQSLILCPTRELAEQVSAEIRRIARAIPNIKLLTLCGGSPLKAQANSLEHGAHIVVGTPGRIDDHLTKNTLDLKQLKCLVLDEADRMLDMGFQATIDAIIEQVPSKRQTMLFSATYPDKIKDIAKRILNNPITAKVASTQDTVRVEHRFYEVKNDHDRIEATKLLLLENDARSSVVFCNTRDDVQAVSGALKSARFSVDSLHGDMEQKDRDQTLIRFSNGSLRVLVATDVAARGLDIESIDLVLNYALAREMETYVHRIGRTGRAGAKGLACSVFSSGERFRLDKLANYTKMECKLYELPLTALLNQAPSRPNMSTLRIEGGKKQKLRPGDILGALTSDKNESLKMNGEQIGRIQVNDSWTYVAVERDIAKTAVQKISQGRLKGKRFRARLI